MSVPKFYDSSYKSRYVPGQAIKMDIHNSQLPIHKLKHQTPSSKDGLNNIIEEDIRFAACETIQIACRYANISTPRIVVLKVDKTYPLYYPYQCIESIGC